MLQTVNLANGFESSETYSVDIHQDRHLIFHLVEIFTIKICIIDEREREKKYSFECCDARKI